MRTRISVALNGAELHAIDAAIVLQGVDEGAASWNIATGNRAGNDGQHVNGVEKRYRDVVVNFAIAEKRDLIRRANIIQQVCGWAAAGGDLTVSYRDRQKLRVMCLSLPAVKSPDKWAETYSITFRAYQVPFWQSVDAESAAISAGTSGSTSLRVKETGGGKLCFQATNSSGSTVNTFSISTGESIMSFSSLGLANGETLVIDHSDNGKRCDLRLRIRSTGGVYRSAMNKRSTGSSDELTISPGTRTVSMSAGGAGKITVSCYGRFA